MIRYIRAYDIHHHRMVNVWERLTTKEQIDNCPKACEISVQAETIEAVLEELKKCHNLMPAEAFEEVKSIAEAQQPIYTFKGN